MTAISPLNMIAVIITIMISLISETCGQPGVPWATCNNQPGDSFCLGVRGNQSSFPGNNGCFMSRDCDMMVIATVTTPTQLSWRMFVAQEIRDRVLFFMTRRPFAAGSGRRYPDNTLVATMSTGRHCTFISVNGNVQACSANAYAFISSDRSTLAGDGRRLFNFNNIRSAPMVTFMNSYNVTPLLEGLHAYIVNERSGQLAATNGAVDLFGQFNGPRPTPIPIITTTNVLPSSSTRPTQPRPAPPGPEPSPGDSTTSTTQQPADTGGSVLPYIIIGSLALLALIGLGLFFAFKPKKGGVASRKAKPKSKRSQRGVRK